ncbi:hypothetical protein P9X10_01330 [Bacillus cereus]|nr:hypothetical protein [Bacillus cereus]
MKLSIKYQLKGLKFKLMNGIIQSRNDVLVHANSEETLSRFLSLVGVELNGVQGADVLGDTVYVSLKFNFDFTYKPFTNINEAPQGLEQVVTYVNDHTLYGYMEVKGSNIIVHHYDKELGEDKLEELSTDLIHEDLTDKIFFHIPSLTDKMTINLPSLTE